MRAHGMRNGNKNFFVVIKQDKRKIFTGSMTPSGLAKNFSDANADARTVCGS